MFLCIIKIYGIEDYKGFFVKILVLNFIKVYFEIS